MKLSSLIDKAFVADLLWRKEGKAPLHGLDDVLEMKKKYEKVEFDMAAAKYLTEFNNGPLHQVDTVLQKAHPVIYDLLKIAPNNLFLCGGAVLSILHGSPVNDYDIFFCCKDVEEAEIILNKCLDYLEPYLYLDYRPYRFSQGVITVDTHYTKPFQFIRRIYERPDQILMGFDVWACQHGYGINTGYFTLRTGALSLILHAFPVDTTKRSYSYGSRLSKYHKTKGFDVLFPGVDKNYNKGIDTPDGWIDVKCCDGTYYPCCNDRCCIQGGKCRADEWEGCACRRNVTPQECTKGCETTVYQFHDNLKGSKAMQNDYESCKSYAHRMAEVGRLSMVAFETRERKFLFDFNCGDLRLAIQNDFMFKPAPEAYVLDGSEDWEKFEPLLEILNDPQKRWKTEDPGSQRFGQFNPIIEEPKKWYGHARKEPYYAGIHPDVYVALRLCWKYSEVWQGIPKDIFKMICDRVLIAESIF